jgi:uncharacterized membrane protein
MLYVLKQGGAVDKAGGGRIQKLLHEAFDIGIILKGIDGVLEIIGGIILAAVKPSFVNQVVMLLMSHELSEDPRDVFANFLLKTAHDFSLGSRIFGAIYLLSHGVIKVALVYALLKRRLMAYPAAIIFFVFFIIYQVYRYTISHSAWMIALSVLDLFVILLTWWEYRRLKAA